VWSTKGQIAEIDCSHDGTTVITGHNDGTVTFWNAQTGREEKRVMGHREIVLGMAISPDGTMLATLSAEGPMKLWDLERRQELDALWSFVSTPWSVAFSPDGMRMAVGAIGGIAVHLWDVATRRQLATLSGSGSTFHFTAFSPDGNVLLAINAEEEVHLWRAPSWTEIQTAEAHQSYPGTALKY